MAIGILRWSADAVSANAVSADIGVLGSVQTDVTSPMLVCSGSCTLFSQ
jgi:hypothetical protein